MTDHASCPHADGVICAATLDDAAADPALTLEGAREMLRDAAAAIRHFHGLAPPALSDDWARGLRLAADALEAAREDAERWRALREMDGGEIYALLGDCDGIHPEQADAAIDQARGKEVLREAE